LLRATALLYANGRAEMLGQLDGKGADTAGAGLNEDLLPLLQFGFLDQCLPSRQSYKRNGGGFLHRQTLGLERQRCLLDGDEFSERADPEIIRPRIDLVTQLELLVRQTLGRRTLADVRLMVQW
jgi:hypothetical protein